MWQPCATKKPQRLRDNVRLRRFHALLRLHQIFKNFPSMSGILWSDSSLCANRPLVFAEARPASRSGHTVWKACLQDVRDEMLQHADHLTPSHFGKANDSNINRKQRHRKQCQTLGTEAETISATESSESHLHCRQKPQFNWQKSLILHGSSMQTTTEDKVQIKKHFFSCLFDLWFSTDQKKEKRPAQ